MDTTKIKKGLGRGLSSLIGEAKKDISINKLPNSDLRSIKSWASSSLFWSIKQYILKLFK